MNASDPLSTSVTLLGELRDRPADSDAWQRFVHRYRPCIYAWCRAYPLQPADAEDVTQAILLKLVGQMKSFRYDPSGRFRAWLKTVTRNALHDYLSDRGLAGTGHSDMLRILENVETREGLTASLEAEFDRELLEVAIRNVRTQVSDRQWEAFRLTALEGLSGAEAAARLGMLVATVFTSKSKVQKVVRAEIQRLEGLDGPPQ